MSNYKIEHIELITDKNVERMINSKMDMIESLFRVNNLDIKSDFGASLLFNFFSECLSGQILKATKNTDKFNNKTLSSFYIDDRVGFKNHLEIEKITNDLIQEIEKYAEALS